MDFSGSYEAKIIIENPAMIETEAVGEVVTGRL